MNAKNVLHSFCLCYNAEESQRNLWLLFSVAFTGNLQALTIVEKQNLLSFYEQLNGLLSVIDQINDP